MIAASIVRSSLTSAPELCTTATSLSATSPSTSFPDGYAWYTMLPVMLMSSSDAIVSCPFSVPLTLPSPLHDDPEHDEWFGSVPAGTFWTYTTPLLGSGTLEPVAQFDSSVFG